MPSEKSASVIERESEDVIRYYNGDDRLIAKKYKDEDELVLCLPTGAEMTPSEFKETMQDMKESMLKFRLNVLKSLHDSFEPMMEELNVK